MALRFRFSLAVMFAGLLLQGCEETPTAPGSTFSDCEECPVMVVVPAGTFTMGTPSSERYRGAEPEHSVTIARPFAVGKFEVTFAEWDACVADGGCEGYSPVDEGWGRGNQPVIQVNWNDAQTYLAWLSMKTGHTYRLLSETEWEYAARAGTQTPFSFGETITSDDANYDATTGYNGGPTGEFRGRPMPVGSFRPNAFGLYDMHGNVWEWVQDCWNDDYTETMPRDGSAWLEGDCKGRIMRGGSWEDYSGEVRAGARVASGVDEHYWSDGFRVARDL